MHKRRPKLRAMKLMKHQILNHKISVSMAMEFTKCTYNNTTEVAATIYTYKPSAIEYQFVAA